MWLALQYKCVRWNFSCPGGCSELSVDRRAHPGIQHKPGQQQADGGTGGGGRKPLAGHRRQCGTSSRADNAERSGNRHAAVAVQMHVTHHRHQAPVIDIGQGGPKNHRAERVGAVDDRGPQHRDDSGNPGERDHASPPDSCGSAPICASNCSVLSSSQCSTNIPFSTRQISMERISRLRPVAGIPMNSPA